jgi:hypothetical protein
VGDFVGLGMLNCCWIPHYFPNISWKVECIDFSKSSQKSLHSTTLHTFQSRKVTIPLTTLYKAKQFHFNFSLGKLIFISIIKIYKGTIQKCQNSLLGKSKTSFPNPLLLHFMEEEN